MKTKGSHAGLCGEISEKSAYYTQRANRFVCNILYMINSSNLVLRSEGWVCIFFWKIYVT